MADPTPEPKPTGTIPMDTPSGRVDVPAATHRLHGSDRSGLGEKGWAEGSESKIGHPGDTNVPPDEYEPSVNRPSAEKAGD